MAQPHDQSERDVVRARYQFAGLEVLADGSGRVRLVQLFDSATYFEPVPPEMAVAVLDWPLVQLFKPGEQFEVLIRRIPSGGTV